MDSTKVFVDSIKAVVKFSTEFPTPKQECYAWDNVAIAAIISIAVAYIIITCVKEFRAIRGDDAAFCKEQDNIKRTWAEKDKNRKHVEEISDREDRRNQDLITQKLSLLKELCYVQEQIKEVNDGKESVKYVKKIKNWDSPEVKEYISELNRLLEIPGTETKANESDKVNSKKNDQQ